MLQIVDSVGYTRTARLLGTGSVGGAGPAAASRRLARPLGLPILYTPKFKIAYIMIVSGTDRSISCATDQFTCAANWRVQRNVPFLKSLFKAETAAMSSALSSNPTCLFCAIRAAVTDFGMTMMPRSNW